MSPSPGTQTMPVQLVRLITLGYILICLKNFPGSGYYSEPSEIVLIVHVDYPAAGKEFFCITGLRFAWACVIWVVLLGMTNTNMNGLNIGHRRGRKKLRSPKNWGNIPRTVTPRLFMQSNWNGYFCNAWQKIWVTRSRKWRRLFGKPFLPCLFFGKS